MDTGTQENFLGAYATAARTASFFLEHELNTPGHRYTEDPREFILTDARRAHGAPTRPRPAPLTVPGLRSHHARTQTTRPPTALTWSHLRLHR